MSDPWEDGTRARPYDAIQEAIDAADDGQTIIVLSGTYWETIDFLGKRIEVTGFNPDDASEKDLPLPVIDGLYQDTVVTFARGEDLDTQLSGFTITRGLGELAGGILCAGSQPRISNCLIVGNRALDLSGGGGVYCADSNAVFENCTLSGNAAGPAGAGFFSEGSEPFIVNSILWDNAPIDIGFPLLGRPAPPRLAYSNLGMAVFGEGNISADPIFVYAGYWASPDDAGTLADPLDPYSVWIDGDYHLVPESPCVDAGDPDPAPLANWLDLDGDPRIVNARIDMGSDEHVARQGNLVATYDDISFRLQRDPSAHDPERTYVGQTTVYLDAFFRIELLVHAKPVSAAEGTWTVRTEPQVIGPGKNIVVELFIAGTGVDTRQLTALQGDVVLASIQVGGVFAP